MGNRRRAGSVIEDGSGGKSTTGQVRNRGRGRVGNRRRVGVGNRRVGTRGPKKQRSSSPSFLSALVFERLQEEIFSIYLLLSARSLCLFFLCSFAFITFVFSLPLLLIT